MEREPQVKQTNSSEKGRKNTWIIHEPQNAALCEISHKKKELSGRKDLPIYLLK